MRPQPQLWNVNKRKNQCDHETHISPIVRCGLHALEVTNLNVVASNLLRTCFKSQSLPDSIIFITERHLPLQSAQIHENATKICLNPTVDFKDPKYPIVCGL